MNIRVMNLIVGRVQPLLPYRSEWGQLKAADMHVIGALFALRVVEGCGAGPCVELYIEDDENYCYQTSFDVHWLKDLEIVAGTLKNFFVEKPKVDETSHLLWRPPYD